MSQPRQGGVRNRLLMATRVDDFVQLAPDFGSVPIVLPETHVAKNERLDHVYFIEQGLCSLIANSTEGRIEIRVFGREGLIGVPIVLSTDRSPDVTIVQGEDRRSASLAPALTAALNRSESLRRSLGRYVQNLLVQVSQTAYANADLTIEARLARWILMTQNQLETNELSLIHEFLSLMLGLRRPGVTTPTHVLEGAGMIRARRGRIGVLDCDKLIELAGDACGVAEVDHERLLAEA